MLNKGYVIGRLASDPEVKMTNNNLAISRVNLFCARDYKNQNNERESDLFTLIFYRARAENIAKYGRKGMLICAEYTLKNNNYEKEGRTVYSNDMVVNTWYILNQPQGKAQEQAPPPSVQSAQETSPTEVPPMPSFDDPYAGMPSFDFETNMPPLPE